MRKKSLYLIPEDENWVNFFDLVEANVNEFYALKRKKICTAMRIN